MYLPTKIDEDLKIELLNREVTPAMLQKQVEALEFIDGHFRGGTAYPTRYMAQKAVQQFAKAFVLEVENAMCEVQNPGDMPHTRILRLQAIRYLKDCYLEEKLQQAHIKRREYGQHDRFKNLISDDEIFTRLKRRLDRGTVTDLQGVMDYLVKAITGRMGKAPLVDPPETYRTIADELADVADLLVEPDLPISGCEEVGEVAQGPAAEPPPAPQVEATSTTPDRISIDWELPLVFWLMPEQEGATA
ncbi:hypothetical protein VSS37_05965 [Candidatus Thiothrix sp. Deng01]|uniref:HEPN domain-containing protein n=1 Tax=Candidatus Thiothrix phosphatis TaxID=3112415 RepID=A0ABU6CUP1_9GAMM|nr:hypothetical protein [Candidatus Thiothrix sp. Deng01]MEB4590518.1 hypothetical protein [Candidatus Thiothrix sp. Deng01]